MKVKKGVPSVQVIVFSAIEVATLNRTGQASLLGHRSGRITTHYSSAPNGRDTWMCHENLTS